MDLAKSQPDEIVKCPRIGDWAVELVMRNSLDPWQYLSSRNQPEEPLHGCKDSAVRRLLCNWIAKKKAPAVVHGRVLSRFRWGEDIVDDTMILISRYYGWSL